MKKFSFSNGECKIFNSNINVTSAYGTCTRKWTVSVHFFFQNFVYNRTFHAFHRYINIANVEKFVSPCGVHQLDAVKFLKIVTKNWEITCTITHYHTA